ncbi:MAG TPA: DUF4367 domain-containing protein [Lachnoclostridium phocaeense]|uniref:DUF4367 domain-containing protein n=1 Tax=Lachnoclostridium phocaeense TaxID=1871021 RepID=A0A921I0Y0_9FIRM|nr:DUF4367 domain-containing protein [Lachnoclostridium phocaeense]
MREHFNDEQSCQEKREEEQFAAFMEEQMQKEAEQIEEELKKNPEIARLSPGDGAKERLYEKIEEYERQQAVRRLSPEDQEALRLGRQIQQEKAREEESKAASRPGSVRKRFFKRLAGVAAVVVIVAAVGITGVGGPDRVMEVAQQLFGGREVTKVNSNENDVLSSTESEEEKAYQEIKNELGIEAVRIVKLLPEMEFLYMQIDQDLLAANLFYDNNGEIISYIINCSQDESVWGRDIEDTFIREYKYQLELVQVSVQEYEIEQTGEKKYSANFDYQDIHYQLTGIMKQQELEGILNNLHFL